MRCKFTEKRYLECSPYPSFKDKILFPKNFENKVLRITKQALMTSTLLLI